MKKWLVLLSILVAVFGMTKATEAVPMAYQFEGTLSAAGADDYGLDGASLEVVWIIDADNPPGGNVLASSMSYTWYQCDYDLIQNTLTLSGTDFDDGYYTGSSSIGVRLRGDYADMVTDDKMEFYAEYVLPGDSSSYNFSISLLAFFSPGYFTGDPYTLPVFLSPGGLEDVEYYGVMMDPTEPSPLYDIEFVAGRGAPVPEPATVLLLGTGIVGLAGFRKKFKK